MHDDFGVVVACQVIVVAGEDFRTQLRVVGQLAVEAECKPLPLLDVRTFQGLGVAPIFGAAGRVADMADGGPAGMRNTSLTLPTSL